MKLLFLLLAVSLNASTIAPKSAFKEGDVVNFTQPYKDVVAGSTGTIIEIGAEACGECKPAIPQRIVISFEDDSRVIFLEVTSPIFWLIHAE